MTVPAPQHPDDTDGAPEPVEIGKRVRWARTRRGTSMRAVAAAVGISQSALSQIETGKSQPSVQTLYRLVRELAVSFDDLVGPAGDPDGPHDDARNGPGSGERSSGVLGDSSIEFLPLRAQKRIELDTGVTWHRLGRPAAAGAEFFRIVHPPGSDSAPDGTYASHAGHEFVYVLTGTLRLEIGFDTEHLLHAGDAVSFAAGTPHRASNPGTESTEIICVITGGHIDK